MIFVRNEKGRLSSSELKRSAMMLEKYGEYFLSLSYVEIHLMKEERERVFLLVIQKRDKEFYFYKDRFQSTRFKVNNILVHLILFKKSNLELHKK